MSHNDRIKHLKKLTACENLVNIDSGNGLVPEGTWTNVDLSSIRSWSIHWRVWAIKKSFKIGYLKLKLYLQGDNALTSNSSNLAPVTFIAPSAHPNKGI